MWHTQMEANYIPLDSCLQCLSLHTVWLPDGEFVHVGTLSRSTVNAPGRPRSVRSSVLVTEEMMKKRRIVSYADISIVSSMKGFCSHQTVKSDLTLVLRSVINLITLAPQFCARVRGMTSSAFPIAA